MWRGVPSKWGILYAVIGDLADPRLTERYSSQVRKTTCRQAWWIMQTHTHIISIIEGEEEKGKHSRGILWSHTIRGTVPGDTAPIAPGRVFFPTAERCVCFTGKDVDRFRQNPDCIMWSLCHTLPQFKISNGLVNLKRHHTLPPLQNLTCMTNKQDNSALL